VAAEDGWILSTETGEEAQTFRDPRREMPPPNSAETSNTRKSVKSGLPVRDSKFFPRIRESKKKVNFLTKKLKTFFLGSLIADTHTLTIISLRISYENDNFKILIFFTIFFFLTFLC
jgi:hypothetical protein